MSDVTWTKLRHQVLRELTTRAAWHDGDIWHFQVHISTKSQMARAANDLADAGMIQVPVGALATVADAGRSLLAKWDDRHPAATPRPEGQR